jgi:hypothetical protein
MCVREREKEREKEDSVVCSQQCVPSTKFYPSPTSNAGYSLAILLVCRESERRLQAFSMSGREESLAHYLVQMTKCRKVLLAPDLF